MNNKEHQNPSLARRRFYLEPETMAYLDQRATELGLSTSQYLDMLVKKLKQEAK